LIAEGPVDEENYEPEEEELIPDDAVVSAAPASLEEVLQSEAEVLAAEIEAMEEEGIDQSDCRDQERQRIWKDSQCQAGHA
jgi:hypothetical protein